MNSPNIVVFNKRFELWPTRYGHVKCFCSEETLRIEKIEEIIVHQVSKQLIGETVQRCQLWKWQIPLAVRRTIDETVLK